MIYEYECPECLTLYDLTKDDPPVCFVCRVDLERKFSVPSLKFKGSGFYKTDKSKENE